MIDQQLLDQLAQQRYEAKIVVAPLKTRKVVNTRLQKRVVVDPTGVEYASAYRASKDTGIPLTTLRSRCDRNLFGWSWRDK